MAKSTCALHSSDYVIQGDSRAIVPPRWLLYAVVFLCGAVLMGLEIVGSRILAPTFGNSIFVWGSLISVVLAALSLGYWLGGKAADRWPKLSVMGIFIAVPGWKVVSNVIGIIQGRGSVYFRAMYRTLADTFLMVYVFPVIESRGETISDELNIILIAGRGGFRLSRVELMKRVGRLGGRLVPAEELSEYAAYLLEFPVVVAGAPLLTDDYAPVETLRAGIE